MDKTKAVNYKKLTQEQLDVLEGKSTERPFTGHLLNNEEAGDYTCAACGSKLFESNAKFESGTGWPSFDAAIPGATMQINDNSDAMSRSEVVCANCGGHLGHVFNDGPLETTGQRYCINSLSLDFEPTQTKPKQP